MHGLHVWQNHELKFTRNLFWLFVHTIKVPPSSTCSHYFILLSYHFQHWQDKQGKLCMGCTVGQGPVDAAAAVVRTRTWTYTPTTSSPASTQHDAAAAYTGTRVESRVLEYSEYWSTRARAPRQHEAKLPRPPCVLLTRSTWSPHPLAASKVVFFARVAGAGAGRTYGRADLHTDGRLAGPILGRDGVVGE